MICLFNRCRDSHHLSVILPVVHDAAEAFMTSHEVFVMLFKFRAVFCHTEACTLYKEELHVSA